MTLDALAAEIASQAKPKLSQSSTLPRPRPSASRMMPRNRPRQLLLRLRCEHHAIVSSSRSRS